MTIIAKYSGTCTRCGGSIKPGDKIDWERGGGSRHVTCPEANLKAKVEFDSAPIHFQTIGHSKFDGSSIGSTFRHSRHGIVTVVGVKATYISADWAEDNDMFDLEGGGYEFDVAARPATEEEAAPILASEAEEQRRRNANSRAEAIKRRIRDEGERPEAPDGEQINIGGIRILDSQNIYGGGDWFVVTDSHVWYVENHGMDGDLWAANNVATGGAGGIGWRIPRDETVITDLQAIEAVLDPEAAAKRQPLPIPAAYQECVAEHVDTTVWPKPEGTPERPGNALWVRLAGPVLCGQAKDGSLLLAVRTPDAHDRYGVSCAYIAGNYAFALRYQPTPERLAQYHAALPEWVSAEQVELISSTWLNQSYEAALQLDQGLIGRFRLARSEGWAASSRDTALHCIIRSEIASDVEFTPSPELLHSNGESRFASHPFALWSDGAATVGRCHSQATGDGLPKAASDLLAAALQQKSWTEGGRWKSLLTVTEVQVEETILNRNVRRYSSSQEATLERIAVHHADGHVEQLLRLSEEGGAMGEDGDAWDSVQIYLPEEITEAKADFQKLFEYYK